MIRSLFAVLLLSGCATQVEYRYKPVRVEIDPPPAAASVAEIEAMTEQQAEGYLRSLFIRSRQYDNYCFEAVQRNNAAVSQ